MTKISQMLPALAVTAGLALVMVTSGFTKTEDDPFWVLKAGAQVGSVNPADYEKGAPNNCIGTIHFCAFKAPESTNTGTPSIHAVPGLVSDLQDLFWDNEGYYNISGCVLYRDLD